MDSPVCSKSFAFAVRIVKLARHLVGQHREYVLSRQLMRAGTSIGANVNEAQAAQSRADFVSKMAIASKEARETRYWLDLLVATDYLDENDEHTRSLMDQSSKLIRLLTAIVKTTQSKK